MCNFCDAIKYNFIAYKILQPSNCNSKPPPSSYNGKLIWYYAIIYNAIAKYFTGECCVNSRDLNKIYDVVYICTLFFMAVKLSYSFYRIEDKCACMYAVHWFEFMYNMHLRGDLLYVRRVFWKLRMQKNSLQQLRCYLCILE